MRIIDSHQHLWNLEKFPYSWCAGTPLLNRSFLPDDYRQAASTLPAGHEVVASIHVEANVDEPHQIEETAWLTQLAAQPGNPIHAIVAAAQPEYSNFRAQLDEQQKFPLVKGIRRVLFPAPDELWQTPLFAENLRALPEYDYSFDLCIGAQQRVAGLKLVQACPQTSFVLDHCGRPELEGGVLDPWRAELKNFAAQPNVVCKVSGLLGYGNRADWEWQDFQPYLEHVLESFGPDRVLWGSDWPVCNLAATFSQWLDVTLKITAQESEENRRKLFHDNAMRIYRLEI